MGRDYPAVFDSWVCLHGKLKELQELAHTVYCTELFHISTIILSGLVMSISASHVHPSR